MHSGLQLGFEVQLDRIEHACLFSSSLCALQKLLTGFKFEDFPDTRCIDVRDVAEAHILAAVYPEAKVGRVVPQNSTKLCLARLWQAENRAGILSNLKR